MTHRKTLADEIKLGYGLTLSEQDLISCAAKCWQRLMDGLPSKETLIHYMKIYRVEILLSGKIIPGDATTGKVITAILSAIGEDNE